jgi:hypothetical protein
MPADVIAVGARVPANLLQQLDLLRRPLVLEVVVHLDVPVVLLDQAGVDQLAAGLRGAALLPDCFDDATVGAVARAVEPAGHQQPECGIGQGLDLGVLVEAVVHADVGAVVGHQRRPPQRVQAVLLQIKSKQTTQIVSVHDSASSLQSVPQRASRGVASTWQAQTACVGSWPSGGASCLLSRDWCIMVTRAPFRLSRMWGRARGVRSSSGPL